jgi:hypothetical protein
MQPNQAPDIAARGPTTRPCQQPTARVAEHHWPRPGCVPSPPGLASAGWPAAPTAGIDRQRPLGRRPGPPGAPAVTGPLTAQRQPRRRRITPNTNTTTTTMISTHNHVDMAASLVGPGAVQTDATAAHPSKQLGHGKATSPSRSSHEYRHPGLRDSRAGGRRRPEHAPPQGPGPAGYGLVPALPHRSQPAAAADSGGLPTSAARKRAELWTPATAVASRGTPRQRTRSTASSGTVRAPAAIPRGRLGPGARGVRPAPARTHEPGRIVPHESIGLGCPRRGRRLWPG